MVGLHVVKEAQPPDIHLYRQADRQTCRQTK